MTLGKLLEELQGKSDRVKIEFVKALLNDLGVDSCGTRTIGYKYRSIVFYGDQPNSGRDREIFEYITKDERHGKKEA